jgi:hypothetical protein
MSTAHAFVSAIADGGDATLVRPSNWNAAHTGLADTLSEPTVDTTILANYSASITGLPLIIDSGRLIDVQAGAFLDIKP